MLRRRSLAALRAEVEPVGPVDYARFLPAWQGVGGRCTAPKGCCARVEQLSGAVLPASAVESLVLPSTASRTTSPAMLDELLAAGEVLWQGHGALPATTGGCRCTWPTLAHLTLPGPDPDLDP
jgi:ATP-dependent Lhr-like helicase